MGFWKTTGKVAGSVTSATGRLLTKAGKAVYRNKGELYDATAKTGSVAADATVACAKAVYDHREEIAGATAGLAKGAADAVVDASGHLIKDDWITENVQEIEKQSRSYKALTSHYSHRLRTGLVNRPLLLDTLVVGGETLGAYIDAGKVPDDIQRAYELAYPDLAASTSFADRVESLDGRELVGFTSGIKGKLFEIQYVDYLNDGNLPESYTAELASSPTMAGWDIAIAGPDSEMSEVIQAKATESVSYVADALEKYPHIDVVTTSEVYSSLVMQGYADDVINSGIAEEVLQSSVDSAIDNASVGMDWVPSPVMLALIAFSAYNKENLSQYQKAREVGERVPKTYLAYLVGGVAAVATGTWWVAIIGGVGSRLLLSAGQAKRERYSQLKQTVKTNQQVLERLEGVWQA